MKRLKAILVLLVIGIFSMQLTAHGQLFRKKSKRATAAQIKEQIEKLTSSDPAERDAAAEKLGGMGKDARSAIPFLIAMLSVKRKAEQADAAEQRRAAVTKALTKITGEDFGDDTTKWEKWWEKDKTKILGKRKKRVAAKPGLLQKPIPEGTPQDIREQILNLKSFDPGQQTLAARKLGQMGGRAKLAIPFLIGIMAVKKASDEGGVADTVDSIKCSEAATALAKITGKDFGCKPDTWREWWQENKGQILKKG